MEIENKDIALGALLIGIVLLAGWVGFLYVNPVTKTHTHEDEETVYVPVYIEETPDGIYGLPSDWSTAPNASYIMLYNETGSLKISLEDILKGVSLWLEQNASEAAGGGEIYAYTDALMELYSFKDPGSGLYVTGVDLLDVIEFSNTHFGYDLEFTSHNSYSPVMEATTQEIYRDIGFKDYVKPWILAIAADGKWLANAPLGFGELWGNFSVFADYTAKALYNLKQIDVTSSWEVEVLVNGILEYTINRTNIIDPYSPDGLNYTYYTDGTSNGKYPKFNFNRQYWGRNISSIINMTSAKGLDYTVKFVCFDDYTIRKNNPLNNTDINNGLTLAKYQEVNGTIGSGWPEALLPVTDQLPSLIYEERRFAETDQTITDPYWPYPKFRGYHGGPFYLIVPGWVKESYGQSIIRIEVTT